MMADVIERMRAALAEWPRLSGEVGVTVSAAEIAERHATVTATFD